MKQDIDRHSSTNDSQEPEDRKKYVKLTPEIKQLFIEKIVFDNLSIKQASEMLRINYSSAKAIASEHRKIKVTKVSSKPSRACLFRLLSEEDESIPVSKVCSTIGGLLVAQKTLPKRKLISKLANTKGFNFHEFGSSFREVNVGN